MYNETISDIIRNELNIYGYNASAECVDAMARKITYLTVGVEVD